MAAIKSANLGRKADKIVRDALLAAARQDPERLKRVAEAAWQKAESGDMVAFREIADRIDGKVAQAIIGGDETDPAIQHDVSLKVQFVAASTEKVTVERADTTT